MQKVWLIQEVKTKKYFDCNCSLSVDLTFQGKSWWQWKTTHHQEIENRHSDLFAVGTSCLVSSVKTKRASQDIKQLSHETMFENRVSIFFKICTRHSTTSLGYMIHVTNAVLSCKQIYNLLTTLLHKYRFLVCYIVFFRPFNVASHLFQSKNVEYQVPLPLLLVVVLSILLFCNCFCLSHKTRSHTGCWYLSTRKIMKVLPKDSWVEQVAKHQIILSLLNGT